MRTTPLRVGVVGCGHWGPNHLRVFSQLPGSVVTAAADVDLRRRTAVSGQYPGLVVLDDYRALVGRDDVDAVVVCVPTRRHGEVVQAALEAGKHVLCEKPLTPTVAEAQELVDLAGRRGLVLMTGHVFLFNPGILKLRALLDEQVHGRLHYLRALRTNLGPIRKDVNSVYDLASHDISIFNYLLNATPVSVSAVGASFLQPGIEDVAFMTLTYPDGIIGAIQVSWLDPKKLREIVVVGDRKMIVWDELAPAGPVSIYDKSVVREQYYDDFGQFHLLAREGDLTIPRVPPQEPLKVQNQFFLDAVARGALERCDGVFSTDVVRVLEATAVSLQRGGAPVEVRA
ncbi:MAG: Gfo/Idh/MocA family protein [Vicinamibacterales bacterium]